LVPCCVHPRIGLWERKRERRGPEKAGRWERGGENQRAIELLLFYVHLAGRISGERGEEKKKEGEGKREKRGKKRFGVVCAL